jgi:uncharacterized sulfatase
MTGISFLEALLGKEFSGREFVFAERGWHSGPITRTDGFDLSRSITSERYLYIYNAIPGQEYCPVDMPDNPAWLRMQQLHDEGKLSALHDRLYFQNPRPIFELYDLGKDPVQLNNLAGRPSMKTIEAHLRVELDKWMVRESDYLPLPGHVYQQLNR